MITAILIGALSGVVAAICGVGGGIVMVPLFVSFLGMSQKNAVATSLAAIVLPALLASIKNHGNHFVDWKVAVSAGVAGATASWFAADALKHLGNRSLTVIFAVVMITMGFRMLFTK